MTNVLTLTEVADYLRVHPSTIYRLLRSGQIPAFRMGSDWRFNQESIDRWRLDSEDAAKLAGSVPERKSTSRGSSHRGDKLDQ